MTYRVVILQQAIDDLTRNARWWSANHSVDQALAWLESVEGQLLELSELPERFGICPEDGLFKYDIRQMPVGLGSRKSYRVVYTIRKNEVFVLTIRRAEEDRIQFIELPKL
jgi:plasmid stabilization system protein ParE